MLWENGVENHEYCILLGGGMSASNTILDIALKTTGSYSKLICLFDMVMLTVKKNMSIPEIQWFPVYLQEMHSVIFKDQSLC